MRPVAVPVTAPPGRNWITLSVTIRSGHGHCSKKNAASRAAARKVVPAPVPGVGTELSDFDALYDDYATSCGAMLAG